MKETNERIFSLINEETGEILHIAEEMKTMGVDVSKFIVDKMLSEAKSLADIDMKVFYSYLRKSNRINQYQQVALLGAYIDLDRTQELTEGGVLFAYCYKMLGFMHSFTNVLKRNQKTDIQSWTELYEMLEITNPTTRTKFKKFCLSNDIVRVNKVMRCKDNNKLYTQFIVNPFIFRKAKHVGQVALSRFGDVVIGGVNTDSYAVKYLEFSDILTPTHNWNS